MSDAERFIELWNDYLEGELGDPGFAELKELMVSDSALVELAADTYQVHRLLGIIAEDGPMQKGRFVSETMARIQPHSGINRWRIGGVVAAAAAAIVIGVALLIQTSGNPVIAKILEAEGILRWTGVDGEIMRELEVGHSLGGGTLESLSADSWARLKLHDGSEITVLGQTTVYIPTGAKKVWYLRNGRLFVKVYTRRDKQPLLIHTPTAKFEANGVQLDVSAELADTILTVNEGSVRVTRLVDGSVVDVAAKHRIVASANAKKEFKSKLRAESVGHWKSDLLLDASDGTWGRDSKDGYPELKAVAVLGKYLDAKKTEPRVFFHCALSVSRGDSSPVVLTDGATVRVRGRSTGNFYFGISTKHIDGDFAGKYELAVDSERAGLDGLAFDIELPLTEFAPHTGTANESPFGTELIDIWCITYEPGVELSISSVEIVSGSVSGLNASRSSSRIKNPKRFQER